MKTLKRVEVTPVYVETMPEVMEQGKVYISLKYKVAIHICLCGTCGSKTVTPLGEKEWTLTDKEGKITLSPSIGNYQMPCKSHYIITNGKANFV